MKALQAHISQDNRQEDTGKERLQKLIQAIVSAEQVRSHHRVLQPTGVGLGVLLLSLHRTRFGTLRLELDENFILSAIYPESRILSLCLHLRRRRTLVQAGTTSRPVRSSHRRSHRRVRISPIGRKEVMRAEPTGPRS